MEQQGQQQNAKFVFYYMLSLVTLVFMALAVGSVIFQVINKNIYDALSPFSGQYDSGALKFALSAIIAAAPIYYFMMWLINKNLYTGLLQKESAVRRWLTYIILFITSVVVLGWIIAVVYNFLQGELSLKFGLKALTAIAISGVIFVYYLFDIKREKVTGEKYKYEQSFFYGTAAFVLLAVIFGFVFVESPTQTRNMRYDESIITQFDKIDSSMNLYFSDTGKLPDNLQILIDKKVYYITSADISNPINNEKYTYKKDAKDTYEICATFLTTNKNVKDVATYTNDRWPHDAGFQCLTQKVRSEVKQIPPVPQVAPTTVPVK